MRPGPPAIRAYPPTGTRETRWPGAIGKLVSGVLLSWFLPTALAAQATTPTIPPSSVAIGRLPATPLIDGRIDDEEWAGATLIDRPFFQFQPDFGQDSEFRTIVRIAQTDTSLLIAVEAMDPDMERLSAARTQRDGGLGGDDSIQLMLDTFGDGRTAYSFQVNALGTQEDERIADNGRTVDDRWDAAWSTATLRLDDRWAVEMEIPFSVRATHPATPIPGA